MCAVNVCAVIVSMLVSLYICRQKTVSCINVFFWFVIVLSQMCVYLTNVCWFTFVSSQNCVYCLNYCNCGNTKRVQCVSCGEMFDADVYVLGSSCVVVTMCAVSLSGLQLCRYKHEYPLQMPVVWLQIGACVLYKCLFGLQFCRDRTVYR